jgi:hypothetical protein
MSELQRFLPADQDMLVGLFLRVGYWMSQMDDTDIDEESEQKEEAQLFKILTKLSQSEKIGALCSEISAEALRQKGSWSRWRGQMDAVLPDVKKAKDLIVSQGTVDELPAFGKCLMMIATAVAQAFREEADDIEEEGSSYFSWLSEKALHVALALNDRAAYKDLNISPAEDTALNDLLNTLKS